MSEPCIRYVENGIEGTPPASKDEELSDLCQPIQTMIRSNQAKIEKRRFL